MGIKPQDLDNWIAALRSGLYGQCYGYLQKTDEEPSEDGDDYETAYPVYLNAYCCLGVYDVSKGISYKALNLWDLKSTDTQADIGLTETCRNQLGSFNDVWRFTFNEIADMLEANRESLIAIGDFPGDWYADHSHHLHSIG